MWDWVSVHVTVVSRAGSSVGLGRAARQHSGNLNLFLFLRTWVVERMIGTELKALPSDIRPGFYYSSASKLKHLECSCILSNCSRIALSQWRQISLRHGEDGSGITKRKRWRTGRCTVLQATLRVACSLWSQWALREGFLNRAQYDLYKSSTPCRR
jgi:hypothetical protein